MISKISTSSTFFLIFFLFCACNKEPQSIPVSSVTIDKNSVSIYEGESTVLTATVSPENASDKTVSWTSSDQSVATVTDGKITALKAGSATITVKTNDGGKTANCKVDVLSVDEYEFYKTYTSVKKGGSVNISRLILLMPCPETNEYQNIINLKADKGTFCDARVSETVLYYETNSMSDGSIEVSETFGYQAKKVLIDFEKTAVKNIYGNVSPENYLDSDGIYIDLDNKTIKNISTSLWAQSTSTIDYARKCYEYVAKNCDYIHGSWRSLSKILEEGGGECGDFSTLFVNLMRYQKIPARHNIGVWKTGGFHVWPDFYDEDFGWIPLDPTFKHSNPAGDYFGRYDGDLIIVSQGLTSFSNGSIKLIDVPLQTYYCWWWKTSGSGEPSTSFSISPVK